MLNLVIKLNNGKMVFAKVMNLDGAKAIVAGTEKCVNAVASENGSAIVKAVYYEGAWC